MESPFRSPSRIDSQRRRLPSARRYRDAEICGLRKSGYEKSVDACIAAAPKEVQPKLKEVRAAIREVTPDAAESISYRIPYYSYKGRLAWFGLHRAHIGLHLRRPVIEKHKDELTGYETTKSSVHLPLDKKVPVPLIKKLVRARMKMNEAQA